jgi:hypothetical protein
VIAAALLGLALPWPGHAAEGAGVDLVKDLHFTYAYLEVRVPRSGDDIAFPPAADIGRFLGEIGRQNLFPRVVSAPFGLALDTDPRNGFDFLTPNPAGLPRELTWRLGFEVVADTPVQAPLQKAAYAYAQVARVQQTGPYGSYPVALDRLGPFMEERALKTAGPFLIRWFDDPAQTPPERCRFEIAVPVEGASSSPTPAPPPSPKK